ncbi:MAG: cytochrome-c peroxidase [Flavobacteriales bacterium]
MKRISVLSVFLLIVVLIACRKDVFIGEYETTPYQLRIPQGFPQMVIPANNPMTVEGVELGRKLFYEELLSADNTQSCASCHLQSNAFADPRRVSVGITGAEGTRNAMALINLGWEQFFFWDGRSATLEDQIFEPIRNPVEMNDTWPNVERKLRASEEYRYLFHKAFGTPGIDSVRAVKAIAQFLRTMISGNSKFDKVTRGQASFTPSEANGFDLFMRDKDDNNGISGGDCFHCHGPILMAKQLLANNGLDTIFIDPGKAGITFNPSDVGKFKTTTLRNIELTGPYMHDGRFATLDEVINHYSSGVKVSSTIDPLMKFAADGGVGLTPQEKIDMKNFLLTLTDWDFINDPAFSDPEL